MEKIYSYDRRTKEFKEFQIIKKIRHDKNQKLELILKCLDSGSETVLIIPTEWEWLEIYKIWTWSGVIYGKTSGRLLRELIDEFTICIQPVDWNN